MNQMSADAGMFDSEAKHGSASCWVWLRSMRGAGHVYAWGRRTTVRRYIYESYLARGYELAGPLAPGERLVTACGCPGCVSPYHHVPAEEARARRDRGEPLLPRKVAAPSPERELSDEERWERAQRANFAPNAVPPWY